MKKNKSETSFFERKKNIFERSWLHISQKSALFFKEDPFLYSTNSTLKCILNGLIIQTDFKSAAGGLILRSWDKSDYFSNLFFIPYDSTETKAYSNIKKALLSRLII